MQKISVAILGCCVPRDTIGLYHEGEGFKVDRFVQSANPISVISTSPLLKKMGTEIYKYCNDKKFYLRNYILDINKWVLPYISEKRSEWLLIDVAGLRCGMMEYPNGRFTVFGDEAMQREVINSLVRDGYIANNGKYVRVAADKKELQLALDSYIEGLLQYYTEEKMILFDVEPANYCVLKDGTASPCIIGQEFETVKKGYDYVISRLPKAHVIEFPVNTLADEGHRWGKYPLHYISEYYNYAYSALNKITRGGGIYPAWQKKKICIT